MTKNFDISTLWLFNYRTHLQNEIRGEFDNLLINLKSILLSDKDIKPQFSKIIGNTFDLRVKTIHWLLKDGVSLTELLNDVYPLINRIGENPKYSILYDNILFALRSIKRLTKSLNENELLTSSNFDSKIIDFPMIKYSQFIDSLAYIPNDILATKIIDWINASLYIEISILSIVLIQENELVVLGKTLDEIAETISDSAQEYSALAVELGFISSNSYFKKNYTSDSIDSDFLDEQQMLADSDLNDYYNNLES